MIDEPLPEGGWMRVRPASGAQVTYRVPDAWAAVDAVGKRMFPNGPMLGGPKLPLVEKPRR